jgi:hypothetical protein
MSVREEAGYRVKGQFGCSVGVGLFLLITACFDVQPVDMSGTRLEWPTVRRIDDFENMFRPSWNLLFPWRCLNWPDPQNVTCGAAQPGVDGASQFLDFHLESTAPDDNPGAQLSAYRSSIPLDLRGYDQIAFAAKLTESEPGSISMPADFELRISLDCTGLASSLVELGQDQFVSVLHVVRPVADGTWHQFVLDLDTFDQPEWEDYGRIEARRCLGSVESVSFVVTPTSSPWESRHAAGRLEIDDVELYTWGAPEELRQDIREVTPWACLSYLAENDFSDVRLDEPACGVTESQPSLTFDVDYPSTEGESWSQLCTSIRNVDSLSHEDGVGVLDASAFHEISFSAKFAAAELAPDSNARFLVSAGCNVLLPDQYPTVDRAFEVLPGWSTYTLPFASFEPPAYPSGFDDVTGCLAHVDGLCFRTKLERGETSSGTLTIDDVVLR